jgi:lon-related putative ATP-dependent protease
LGALVTNFTMLKAGALHRANGGYLMVDARDVLTKPLAWEALKRALRSREIHIGVLDQDYQLTATHTLEPEAIPLDVKVVLIGDPTVYYLLHQMDEEFRELFKVKADFATHMDWTDENVQQYAQFIGTICAQEKLRHFDPSAVARVVEHSARQVSDQRKLATRFGDVVDLIRQSSYWAGVHKHRRVSAKDVQTALDEHVYRSSRVDELLQEIIMEGSILIQTDGAVVGQCNGLAVMQMGDYAFGKPSRITARTFAGTPRVVSIDRETELGGPIHSKGSLILVGYLNGTVAHDTPLSVAASITFEQVYEGVEGDSASTTELYALLSSLSGLPLRQDIAVTGSMNQLGDVQVIGGVNEKIEGFYELCLLRGLTGKQGVIIPQGNVRNLMLRAEVIRAVESGKFHIYAVGRVEEGISLLTGVPAGERQGDGSYPEGTVYAAIQARLATLAAKAREMTKGT